MAVYRQPAFQQEMLKAHSKASMRGQRPKTAALQSRLVEMDLARKLAFGQIGLTKQRADLSHRGRMAQLGMDKKALKDRQAQLPWTIGIGAGTALLSGLEGKRRADLIRKQTWQNQLADQQMRGAINENTRALNLRLGIPVEPRWQEGAE